MLRIPPRFLLLACAGSLAIVGLLDTADLPRVSEPLAAFEDTIAGAGGFPGDAWGMLRRAREGDARFEIATGSAADEPVPESEGLTAGRLREIISALMTGSDS